MPLSYTQAETLTLKTHPEFSEKWVQERVMQDTTILGLGEVELVAAEKIQPKAGRLDLLLHDEQLNRRYEVELMLGPTDPSHIIRCIEYWDIERRRYPAYDHVAVLVAENITSRFLNVMSLLAGSIPLIAIQVNALKVDDKIVLHFARVMDQTELRTDDEYEGGSGGGGEESVDRSYWESKVGSRMLGICDELLTIANATSSSPLELKYKKRHIAIATEGSFFNVAHLALRKTFVLLTVQVGDPKLWLSKLEEQDLVADLKKATKVRVRLQPADMDDHSGVLSELLAETVKISESS